MNNAAAVPLGESDGAGFIVVFIMHFPTIREALVDDTVAVVVGVCYRRDAARIRYLRDPAVFTVFVGVDCARWNGDGVDFVFVVGEVYSSARVVGDGGEVALRVVGIGEVCTVVSLGFCKPSFIVVGKGDASAVCVLSAEKVSGVVEA